MIFITTLRVLFYSMHERHISLYLPVKGGHLQPSQGKLQAPQIPHGIPRRGRFPWKTKQDESYGTSHCVWAQSVQVSFVYFTKLLFLEQQIWSMSKITRVVSKIGKFGHWTYINPHHFVKHIPCLHKHWITNFHWSSSKVSYLHKNVSKSPSAVCKVYRLDK